MFVLGAAVAKYCLLRIQITVLRTAVGGSAISTFSQWWLSFRKTETPRQVTWVCGTEPVLVDEVVDLIKNSLNPDPINLVYLDAKEESERFIWNDLRQLPFGNNKTKLTVIRGAERLKQADWFIQYIKDRSALPRNYVVFVSSESFLRKGEDESRRMLWLPLEYLKTRGAIVECKAFTTSTAKHAVTWVRDKLDIRGRVAEFLLNRATGDLRLVRDTMNKMAQFPGEVTLRHISEMFEEQPNDTFLGALFSLDRKTAMKALKELPKTEYSKTLGLVDARLELAGLVHDLMVQRKSPGDIAKAAGNKGFLVPDMLPVAKHYDKNRRQRIRNYLAVVDSYTEYGVPDGALEALVVIW